MAKRYVQGLVQTQGWGGCDYDLEEKLNFARLLRTGTQDIHHKSIWDLKYASQPAFLTLRVFCPYVRAGHQSRDWGNETCSLGLALSGDLCSQSQRSVRGEWIRPNLPQVSWKNHGFSCQWWHMARTIQGKTEGWLDLFSSALHMVTWGIHVNKVLFLHLVHVSVTFPIPHVHGQHWVELG